MTGEKITICNRLDQLEVLSAFIEKFSAERDLPGNAPMEINLVLEELIVNTIFYGYDDQDEHTIDINIAFEDKILQLQIGDDGREFNPLLHPEADTTSDLSERKPGGLGIHFVRKIMDEITYTRSGNKNILKLTKHFN